MNVNITSEDYDKNIRIEGIQYQIDHYYEPLEAFRKSRIDIVINDLQPSTGEAILDLGCGCGTFAFYCAKAGAKATGIDYSKESINAAKQITARYTLKGSADFMVGNALKLPFEDSYFDKVVSADFIEHITDEEKVTLCKEIRRVLKDNGSAVIFTPNKTREDIGHVFAVLRHLLYGRKIPHTDLHYGLITKRKFEKILSEGGFDYNFKLTDMMRPYLARIPVLNALLAYNMLWTVRKSNIK